MLFFIRRQLKSKDYATRKAAIEALGKRRGSDVAVQMAGDLANSEEATQVLSSIGERDPNNVTMLAGALSRGDWVLKSAAAIALGQTRRANALAPLLEAATAEHRYWRAMPAVAEALGELGSDKSIEALRSLRDEAIAGHKSRQKDQELDLHDYARREVVNALTNFELVIVVTGESLGKLGGTVKPVGE